MRNGFVLLEVLVALMVAAIMLGALFGAQSLILRAEQRAVLELPLRCGMYRAWLNVIDGNIKSDPPDSIILSDELLITEEAHPRQVRVWRIHHPDSAERVLSICLYDAGS
ncbi:MAG: prepilin-type N-terminal cleavage/methylation domain-containing protein [Kiritimatiellia bacterium]|nr:prepilin-type N-terminal cleavage/methylation domain-containing protein [Lentisphaerota bacterium]